MEQIFAGYQCAIIVDDIIVGGNGVEEHDKNLKKVLDRARQVKLRLNPKKYKFRLREVSYVGHVFTDKGLKAEPTKFTAISEMSVKFISIKKKLLTKSRCASPLHFCFTITLYKNQ